jgi:hypothetical protein
MIGIVRSRKGKSLPDSNHDTQTLLLRRTIHDRWSNNLDVTMLQVTCSIAVQFSPSQDFNHQFLILV